MIRNLWAVLELGIIAWIGAWCAILWVSRRPLVRLLNKALERFVWGVVWTKGIGRDKDDDAQRRWERTMIRKGVAQSKREARESTTWEA